MKKTFIIAEVGINHNGDIEIAKKLILAAKMAGADAVKFQKRAIDRVYPATELDKPRESQWGATNRDQKFGLEFDETEYDEINEVCNNLQIPWFVSPWDTKSVDFMAKYELPYWKIPSALITHTELCQKIADFRKKTFISTGMSTWDEVDAVVKIFDETHCPFVLLHCNSQYPMPDEKANLHMIHALYERYIQGFMSKPEVATQYCFGVGYSGHEVGLITSVAAVAMGATVIERHITLDRAMYGSDQAASMEPGGFARMIDYIRVVEGAMGDGVRIVTPEEEAVKKKLRRNKDIE